MMKSRQQLFNQTIFLALTLVFTACHGQVKTNLSKITTNSPPKMIRTQRVVSGNVGCELQDKAGNLWFSTSGEGVYRFDGKSFTNFTTKDGLNDNDVSAIIEDKAGNILFGTKSGICKYDGEKFSKYFKSDSLTKFGITSLLEDREGNIWFIGMMEQMFQIFFISISIHSMVISTRNISVILYKIKMGIFGLVPGMAVAYGDMMEKLLRTFFHLQTIIKQTKTKETTIIHRILPIIFQVPSILHRKTISQMI